MRSTDAAARTALAAEVSALLEDELGTDPFSSGVMPQTVGELIAFYDSVAGVH